MTKWWCASLPSSGRFHWPKKPLSPVVLYLPNWEEPNKNADWEIFVATQNRQMKGGRAKTNSKRRKEEGDKQNQNWPQHYLHG